MSGNLRTPADVEEELQFMERFLIRLRRSFQLEKETALTEGVKALWTFRERSRCYYQPAVSGMLNDLKQFRYGMIKVEHIPSGIFPRLEALEISIKKARAHFSGTPNRLLRLAGQNTGDD
ncbi:MAG: hypothetical protein KAR40_10515 [Candidatus Sabulitectum sp.]|nr:hypothetical protein [Candidatus Sabulitectum sp.]